MKSMTAGTVGNANKNTGQGYWMYKDGSSYWGIGLMQGREVPLKTTEEIHAEEDVTKKAEWYKEETAKIAEAAKEKVAKKK